MTSEGTKDRILDIAEHLFAEKGFASTSLRSITTKAEVNLAAVNYHFGSKEALLKAVFIRRIDPINEQRLQALDLLESRASSQPVVLEEVLRAFLGPALRMREAWGEQGDYFIQFAGRAHSDSDQTVRKTFLGRFEEIYHRFFPAFQKALPAFSGEALILRIHYMIGAMAHTMAWSKSFSWIHDWPAHSMTVDLQVEHLVQFAAAGMRALLPAGGEEGS